MRPTPRNLLLGGTLVCMYVSVMAARGMAATPPPIKDTLTVTVSGAGTVAGGGFSCSAGTCSQTFAAGKTISLTATPVFGSAFAGWGGDCSGASSTCVVVMNGPKSISASFTTGASGPPPPPAPPVCTVHLGSRDVLLKAPKHHHGAKPRVGTVTVRLDCDQTATGKLKLVFSGLVPTGKGHAKKRAFLVTRTVSLAAHRARKITIKLPAGTLAGLRGKRGQSLSGSLSVKNADGTDTAKLKPARLLGTP